MTVIRDSLTDPSPCHEPSTHFPTRHLLTQKGFWLVCRRVWDWARSHYNIHMQQPRLPLPLPVIQKLNIVQIRHWTLDSILSSTVFFITSIFSHFCWEKQQPTLPSAIFFFWGHFFNISFNQPCCPSPPHIVSQMHISQEQPGVFPVIHLHCSTESHNFWGQNLCCHLLHINITTRIAFSHPSIIIYRDIPLSMQTLH